MRVGHSFLSCIEENFVVLVSTDDNAQLTVTVIEAQRLRATNVARHCHPYVKVCLLPTKKPSFTTKVQHNNTYPQFNETFTFQVRRSPAWLYCVECHNTEFGSKRSTICAQAVYLLRSTMPSVTCLRLSDVSVICRVTYFQFPIQSAFLPCRSARQHSGVLGLPNIGHRTLPKMSVRLLYGAERTEQRNDSELIPTVNMKTRHPVEGYFGSEFRAICNHCEVMAA